MVHRIVFLVVLAGIASCGARRAPGHGVLGGRAGGWHTAAVALRPTYRVRIEYCVP